MSQHADSLIALLQRLTMGCDINAIGQSADDEHTGALLAQISNEVTDEVLPVTGAVAGANDIDDTTLVEVGGTHVIHDNRGIGTFGQPLRIGAVAQQQHSDVVLPDKGHLLGGTSQCQVPVLHRRSEPVATVGQHGLEVVAMLIDSLCRPQRLIEMEGRLEVKPCHACQGDGVIGFLL